MRSKTLTNAYRRSANVTKGMKRSWIKLRSPALGKRVKKYCAKPNKGKNIERWCTDSCLDNMPDDIANLEFSGVQFNPFSLMKDIDTVCKQIQNDPNASPQAKKYCLECASALASHLSEIYLSSFDTESDPNSLSFSKLRFY